MASTVSGVLRMFSFYVWLLILAGEFRSGKGEDVDSSPSFCTSGEWKWDLDVMNARCIEDVMKESDVEVLSALIADGIRRGLWDCTAKALQAIAAAGLSAWDIFSIEHRLLNKELSQLKRVADACKPVQTISPAFEWAESPGSIYLNIKFSHRLDAPATLDVTPDITIMPGQVIIEGHKGTRRFKLALDIYDDIDPENSNWSMGSLGRITITLSKTQRSIWSRLLLKDVTPPRNMHKWWSRAQELEEETISFLQEELKTSNSSSYEYLLATMRARRNVDKENSPPSRGPRGPPAP